jgi:hypothetical protein
MRWIKQYLNRAMSSPVLPVAMFLIILFAVNADVFRVRVYEEDDFAANSLQIQEAKHFREMLGNYSRFGFHHPGPGFFYLFAAGEALFYDGLHVVPTPFNGEFLILLVADAVFLILTLNRFRSYCSAPLLIPLALAVVVLFYWSIGSTHARAPLLSVWMPYAPFLCFVLFIVVCASVAAGRMGDLPLLALTGTLMLHTHMAQILFVTVLGGLACAVAMARERRSYTWQEIYHRNSVRLVWSTCIVAVLCAPPVIELFVQHPNNLQRVWGYVRRHAGTQHGWLQSAWYFAGFLGHLQKPEAVLTDRSTSLLKLALSSRPVVIYWIIFAALAGVALWATRGRFRTLPYFLKYLVLEIGIISVLFLFWGTRITGQLYEFNGFFIYSIQLLGLLIAAALVAPLIPKRHTATVGGVTVGLALAFVLVNPAVFRAKLAESDQAKGIVDAIPGNLHNVKLMFPHDYWKVATGVATLMKREHRQFCVSPDWAVMFGDKNVCGEHEMVPILFITRAPGCGHPIFQRTGLSVDLDCPVEWRPLHTGWNVAAAAGFDTHGAAALVYQNERAQAAVQYGGQKPGAEAQWRWLTSSGYPGWRVVAAADFDANGVPDVIWQNQASRVVSVHYYRGFVPSLDIGWAFLNAAGVPGWHVTAAADFDGNGVPDLIWQNDTTRQVTVNYYGGKGGSGYQGWAYLSSMGDPGWTVAGAGDFDGNGVPDLVWQNDNTREVTIHYYGGARGAIELKSAWLDRTGKPGWTVVAVTDYDGNGVPDLVWQNDATGQVLVSFYGGSEGTEYLGWKWLNESGRAPRDIAGAMERQGGPVPSQSLVTRRPTGEHPSTTAEPRRAIATRRY